MSGGNAAGAGRVSGRFSDFRGGPGARLDVGAFVKAPVRTARVTETSGQNAYPAQSTGAAHGRGALRRRGQGRMTIYYGGSVMGTDDQASVKVDVDANGSIEYSCALSTSSKQGERRPRTRCFGYTFGRTPHPETEGSSCRNRSSAA